MALEPLKKVNSGARIAPELFSDIRDIGTISLTETNLVRPVVHALVPIGKNIDMPIIAFSIYYHLSLMAQNSGANTLYVCGSQGPDTLKGQIWDEIFERSREQGINFKGSLTNLCADQGSLSKRKIKDIIHQLPGTPAKFILNTLTGGNALSGKNLREAVEEMYRHLKDYGSIVISLAGMKEADQEIICLMSYKTVLLVEPGFEKEAAIYADNILSCIRDRTIGIVLCGIEFQEDINNGWEKLQGFSKAPETLEFFGAIPADPSIAEAREATRPLPLAFPHSKASHGAKIAASAIIEEITGFSPKTAGLNLPSRPKVLQKEEVPDSQPQGVSESKTITPGPKAKTFKFEPRELKPKENSRSMKSQPSLLQDLASIMNIAAHAINAGLKTALPRLIPAGRTTTDLLVIDDDEPQKKTVTSGRRISLREAKAYVEIWHDLEWYYELNGDPREMGTPTNQWQWPGSEKYVPWWVQLKLSKGILHIIRECKNSHRAHGTNVFC